MNPGTRGCRIRRGHYRIRLRWLWKRLRGGRLEPARAGWSTGVGLFVGALPVYGLHLPICLALTLPFRLDAVVAYAAANISNPLFAPALVVLEYQVGAVLLHGVPASLDVDALQGLGLTSGLLRVGLGSLAVGVLLGLVGGLSSAALTRKLQLRRSGLRLASRRTRRAYRNASRHVRVYVATKLLFDPIFQQLATLRLRLGRTLDAGCGRGQLAIFLRELGAADTVIGFDWDADKVEVARIAARGREAFWQQSLNDDASWPAVDSVLLVDVLHYLTPDEQNSLLRRAADSIGSEGSLVIREIDREHGLRPFGRIAEGIGCRLGVNRARNLSFLSRRQLEERLHGLGLDIAWATSERSPLLANFLLIATRPRAQS